MQINDLDFCWESNIKVQTDHVLLSLFQTIRQLQAMTLPIPMNPNVSWTLNKTHVRVAFRKTVSTF